jgi:threonylcarbamoyladenosine tRNA methylthiotransferase MtaB
MGFSRLHIFRYSSRPGTAAAHMPGHISEDCKRGRSKQLLALDRTLRRDYVRRHVGHKLDVLWESAQKTTPAGAVWMGLTGNYIRVATVAPPDAESLYNTITPTRFVGARGDQLIGEIDGVPALDRCSL